MARGKSGRIVLEVDPELKNDLYSILAKKNVTLKEWFIDSAKHYIEVGKTKGYIAVPYSQKDLFED